MIKIVNIIHLSDARRLHHKQVASSNVGAKVQLFRKTNKYLVENV